MYSPTDNAVERVGQSNRLDDQEYKPMEVDDTGRSGIHGINSEARTPCPSDSPDGMSLDPRGLCVSRSSGPSREGQGDISLAIYCVARSVEAGVVSGCFGSSGNSDSRALKESKRLKAR